MFNFKRTGNVQTPESIESVRLKEQRELRQQNIDAILVLSKVLEVNNVATTDTQKLADSKIKELIQKL